MIVRRYRSVAEHARIGPFPDQETPVPNTTNKPTKNPTKNVPKKRPVPTKRSPLAGAAESAGARS